MRRMMPMLAIALAVGPLGYGPLGYGQVAHAQGATQGAAAQAAHTPAQSPVRVRGKIESASTDKLTVTTRTGREVTITLDKGYKVTEIAPIDVSAIKPGAFIGTAAIGQPDGTLKAQEIQVFPESMRGIGEGHRPWDTGANSSMTNGTVGDLKVADGRYLTLTYKGGEQKVFVPPDAPVITYNPGTPAMLKPGANVIIMATRGPDNNITASRVGVGKDGLVPPM
jgi:hypothetical protein